jgi:hypothetical protein
MCRIVPEVPKDKLVLSTADPKRPAAYQAPLIIPTCPSKDAQLDAATASAQSLDLQLHHHTHYWWAYDRPLSRHPGGHQGLDGRSGSGHAAAPGSRQLAAHAAKQQALNDPPPVKMLDENLMPWS